MCVSGTDAISVAIKITPPLDDVKNASKLDLEDDDAQADPFQLRADDDMASVAAAEPPPIPEGKVKELTRDQFRVLRNALSSSKGITHMQVLGLAPVDRPFYVDTFVELLPIV